MASKFARRTALLPQPTANIRPQLAPVPRSSAWTIAPIITRPHKIVSPPKQKRASSPAQVIPVPSATGLKPTPVAQPMPPQPASINRDFHYYVNAIEDQRKQNNAALAILTSTLSASMNELYARLTEQIQMLAGCHRHAEQGRGEA